MAASDGVKNKKIMENSIVMGGRGKGCTDSLLFFFEKNMNLKHLKVPKII